MNGYKGMRHTSERASRYQGAIDYKDIDLLKQFVSETGKIVPQRMTNLSAGQQRRLAQSIKRARFMALLSYSDRHA